MAGQIPEKYIEDGEAQRYRSDEGSNGWERGVGSVITERLYINVKHFVK